MRIHPVQRCDIDDASPSPAFHVRKRGHHRPLGRPEVDLQAVLELLIRHFLNAAVSHAAVGIVHKNIDRTELVCTGGDHAFHLSLNGHVAFEKRGSCA